MDKSKGKPGPDAERLVMNANWKDAVKQALKKGKPPATKKSSNKKRKPSK